MNTPQDILVQHRPNLSRPFAVFDNQKPETAPAVATFRNIPEMHKWLSDRDYRYVHSTCGLWVLP